MRTYNAYEPSLYNDVAFVSGFVLYALLNEQQPAMDELAFGLVE